MPAIVVSAAAQSYFELYVTKGGVMMLALIPTSLLTLAIILQSFISLRRGVFFAPGDPELLAAMARKGDVDGLKTYAGAHRHLVLGRLLGRLLTTPDPDEDFAAEHIHREVGRLFRIVHVMSVIANVAPFMGLLGTVIGLMQTFNQFTVNANPNVAQLSGGLYTAMTTTLWGLSIAVPAYIFFHMFRARLIRYEEDTLPDALHAPVGLLMRRASRLAAEELHDTESELRSASGAAMRTTGGSKIDPRAKTPPPSEAGTMRAGPLPRTPRPSNEETDALLEKPGSTAPPRP